MGGNPAPQFFWEISNEKYRSENARFNQAYHR